MDDDAVVGSFLFYHDVWDHQNNCPVHEVGDVRVKVVEASPLPTLSIGDATVEEGEDAEFEVTLSASSSETVRVDYATSGGTAAEGSDYTRSSGPLIFPRGTTARTVTVRTTDDTEQEVHREVHGRVERAGECDGADRDRHGDDHGQRRRTATTAATTAATATTTAATAATTAATTATATAATAAATTTATTTTASTSASSTVADVVDRGCDGGRRRGCGV